MAQVAVMTFGVFNGPPHQGFLDSVPGVFEAVEQAKGYIDRRAHIGREVPMPEFDANHPPSDIPALTLSLWENLESLFAFAYHGAHGEAFKKRREWMSGRDEFPTYVIWWVEDGKLPEWEEACTRLDHLNDRGPSAYAFQFKTPFDADGHSLNLDREHVKKLAGNA